MASLYVKKLVLLPRISKTVIKTVESATELQVTELGLEMSEAMKEMHQLLVEILQSCIDEAKH